MSAPYDNHVGFMGDAELYDECVQSDSKLVQVPFPPSGDWFAADSPLQPSSVDLTIGKVYLPNQEGAAGPTPQEAVCLEPGQTALIVTNERLELPSNVCGLGFVLTGLAMKGLLAPTVGHIDPGWRGPLHIVVINMGRGRLPLSKATPIATVLLYRLAGNVRRNYQERHGTEALEAHEASRVAAATASLAADFAQFRETARQGAEEVTQRKMEEMHTQFVQYGIYGIAILAVSIPLMFLGLNSVADHFSKAQVERIAFERRLTALETLAPLLQQRLIEPAPSRTEETQSP